MSGGTITVDPTQSLTFGTATLNGTDITDKGSIAVNGALTLGSSGNVTITSTGSSIGTIVNDSAIDVQSNATISDVSLSGTGR